MQGTGAYALAMVCEADADRRTATALADRVLCSEIAWIADNLDSHRRWRGLADGSSHLEWHEAKAHAKAAGLKPHGLFLGEPGAPDAFAARRALLLLATSGQHPDAVVLVRDADNQPERWLGLEQARKAREWPFRVVIGLAIPKRESWVLAGFEPQEALARVQRETGDLKRILQRLVGDDYDREQACWTECSLEALTQRGQSNGLAEYLEEVRTRLVPLFTGREAS